MLVVHQGRSPADVARFLDLQQQLHQQPVLSRKGEILAVLDHLASYNAPLPDKEGPLPTEQQILQDLPFILQGLSTEWLIFDQQYALRLPRGLPLPLISILHTLAEPALLYKVISHFVESTTPGLIGQSLRSAVAIELRSYLALIATLEGEIRRGADASKATVTLKRCVLWLREATLALRLMSVMVEQTKAKRGGQVISVIHAFYTHHGDPFVFSFAERLLGLVTRPCYEMLRQWIYDGELSDPYHEFFVREQEGPMAAGGNAWEDKFLLVEELIPSIITRDLANKVFLIGKSLNFIRYNCADSDWVDDHSKARSRELVYGDTATLEASIDEAYKLTMARLTHLMNAKFQLTTHLSALKRYLLLEQGDFVALLMESLASNLDRPAGSQYRHTLTAQLEHAIRGSNAQFDSPDVLRRLDARLTEMDKGDTGWDVFTLEYKLDAPIDVIITAWANRQYLKIFNLLWRVKRVEFALGSTWLRCMTGARGVLATSKYVKDWKLARCTIAEMIHFINQLQYYVLFEVIEASWETLQAAIDKPDCTLDDIILAHRKYLTDITHKGLLSPNRNGHTGQTEEAFTVQLHEILKDMLAYREAVDGLYSFSLTAFTREQEAIVKNETKGWLHDEPVASALRRLPSDEESILPALQNRLSSLSAEFRLRISNLLGDLATQPDVNMRFLGVVMNYNDIYQPRRRKRHPVVTKKADG